MRWLSAGCQPACSCGYWRLRLWEIATEKIDRQLRMTNKYRTAATWTQSRTYRAHRRSRGRLSYTVRSAGRMRSSSCTCSWKQTPPPVPPSPQREFRGTPLKQSSHSDCLCRCWRRYRRAGVGLVPPPLGWNLFLYWLWTKFRPQLLFLLSKGHKTKPRL